MRKILASLTGCLILAGCSNNVAGTGTGGTTTPPEPLPADQLVFSVDYGVGMATYPDYVANVVNLAVYGDGRIYLADEKFGYAARFELAQVDSVEVAELAAKAEKSGLIDESTPYGFPQITDVPSTVVTLHGADEATRVAVYALGLTDNELSKTEEQNRDDLEELIDEAGQLADDAVPTDLDRVEVVQVESWHSTGSAWPGPDPASVLSPATGGQAQACGVLTGTEAATVLDAAVTNGEMRHWTLADGSVALLVVRPLLPSEEPCQKHD